METSEADMSAVTILPLLMSETMVWRPLPFGPISGSAGDKDSAHIYIETATEEGVVRGGSTNFNLDVGGDTNADTEHAVDFGQRTTMSRGLPIMGI